MTAPYVRPYLDSGVFISWLRDSDVGPLADGSVGDRRPASEHVLLEAQNGNYKAVTSFFTMAEVYKKKGSPDYPGITLTDEQNGKILKYFENEWIEWVLLDRLVAEEANRLLLRYKAQKLRPPDAVHLASALRAKCDVFLTWDGPLLAISHPDIRIEFPVLNAGTLLESVT